MTQELIHVRTGDTLYHVHPLLKDGDYKILIPKGTHLWRVSVEPFKVAEPGQALIAFDAPPVGPGTPVGIDTRNTLERLWAGETLSFYSPPDSGALSLSTAESTSPFRADRDRWMYLHLDFPGVETLNWQSRIDLHAGTVPQAPHSLPEPSLALAQRTLAYAHKAGLVAALMRTSGARNDDELVDWVLGQGDLWFSLCRLAGEAEQAART